MNTLQENIRCNRIDNWFDLVENKIKVARGEALTIKQEDLQDKRHAMELRVYAEDPLNRFYQVSVI
jgi:propionyl-CoA carboxylase alpha chain